MLGKVNAKKSISFGALSNVGIVPTRATSKSSIIDLIRDLHPVRPKTGLIRLGPNRDGGYLVPDDLGGVDACFSPRVAETSGFEVDCADRGMDVFLADRTVEGPGSSHEKFHFTRRNVGCFSGEDTISMNEWLLNAGVEELGDLILQMDIEGSEYESIISMPQGIISKFRILVVEFHDLCTLWSRPFFNIASSAFRKILNTHRCVHIHPNNVGHADTGAVVRVGSIDIPDVMEFTFLRKDRVDEIEEEISFPHDRDRDNVDGKSIALPECWYE